MSEEPSGAPTDIGVKGCVNAVEIARGGFAVVYRAYQPEFDRTVAVKLLNLELVDATYRARFQREVRSLGRSASHPNVVTVYDAGFTGAGQPYIIMELQPGGSLADRMTTQGALGVQDAIATGLKLAGALAAAHAAGILHRDIKPENVLLSACGEPQLEPPVAADIYSLG